jgi:hypothetical protein
MGERNGEERGTGIADCRLKARRTSMFAALQSAIDHHQEALLA